LEYKSGNERVAEGISHRGWDVRVSGESPHPCPVNVFSEVPASASGYLVSYNIDHEIWARLVQETYMKSSP
jgi:hypothetical protein